MDYDNFDEEDTDYVYDKIKYLTKQDWDNAVVAQPAFSGFDENGELAEIYFDFNEENCTINICSYRSLYNKHNKALDKLVDL